MSATQQSGDQQHVETSELAGQINDIVTQIKKAILALEKDAPVNEGRVTVTEADITLEAVVTKSGGPDAKFKIFGHDIGFKGELSKEDTQTIEIKLKPRAADAMAFGSDDVSETLFEAMRAVRSGVAHAASDEPRFALDEATVELNFVTGTDGSIDFVIAGERKTANTHTVKLTLASA